MHEQAPISIPPQEQALTPEQQAEREQLALALYQTFVHSEGQATAPLEHPMASHEESAHRELLSQLQNVNGTVPEGLEKKRDWGMNQREHLAAQKEEHAGVKAAVETRLKEHDELQRFAEANAKQEQKTTAHNEKLARRDSEAEGRNAAREAFIARMQTARGLSASNDELEKEADAYVEEVFGAAKHANEGVVDTAELKNDEPTPSQKKNEETGKALLDFQRSFTKKQPEGTVAELLLDDSEIPEFDPDNLPEQPEDRPESDFGGWEVAEEELDDKSSQNIPERDALQTFIEESRQDREHFSLRNRLRRFMGRANDLLIVAAAWSSIRTSQAYEKVNAYFNNDEKKTRRVAIAGAVAGALATYGYVRLTQGGGSPSVSSPGITDTLLPFAPFGNHGSGKELGHHALHAARFGNEVTLKSGVPGGDSIWHEKYEEAKNLHPRWNEHQLQVWTNEQTQHVLDINNLTEEEAEKLKAGTTLKG